MPHRLVAVRFDASSTPEASRLTLVLLVECETLTQALCSELDGRLKQQNRVKINVRR